MRPIWFSGYIKKGSSIQILASSDSGWKYEAGNGTPCRLAQGRSSE